MHNDFDKAAKEILNLSDRAIIAFLNANLGTAFPPDARVTRTNPEYRLPAPSGKRRSRQNTIVADMIIVVGEKHRCHVEIELTRKTGMAIRMFRYDVAEALEHAVEEDGVWTISFPKSLVIYLESGANTPDYELLRVRFPDGSRHEYSAPVIKLTELSVRELTERHLVIFAPLYLLKLRKQVKRAGGHEEREELAGELKKIYREMEAAMAGEKEAGNMTELDQVKIFEMRKVLHEGLFGEYTEFKEDTMDFSNLRVIEKLYAEREEIKRSREEERRLREEAARNILKAGQPVEQVARWIGLPIETVQTLAAQL
ncbi:MAG: hypothetical protein LBF77_06085 [Spirochaetaceae bacterium]|jgi:hypothetical protein|nr:hypothetical protein [Spirochaetaceae bacterium]